MKRLSLFSITVLLTLFVLRKKNKNRFPPQMRQYCVLVKTKIQAGGPFSRLAEAERFAVIIIKILLASATGEGGVWKTQDGGSSGKIFQMSRAAQ